jgi:hypothetical protein
MNEKELIEKENDYLTIEKFIKKLLAFDQTSNNL